MSHNSNNNTSNDKVVKVIGIGGSGIYTTSYMAKNPIQNVKYGIICNYEDYKMFNNSNYPYIEYYKSAIRLLDIYLLLDPMVNGKLRSRADLYRFYTHKPENIEIINSIFCGNPKYLIIVAGFGGSGMYISEYLYTMAQSKNIPATILCSTPFLFEGIKKIERAHNFLGELLNKQFNIVSINAPDMCKANPNISFENCFYYLDNIMREKLKDIVNLIK